MLCDGSGRSIRNAEEAALGQVAYLNRTITTRVRACDVPVGAMPRNNSGTAKPSFTNTDATVVLRFDPLALSILRKGLVILSWRQLQ